MINFPINGQLIPFNELTGLVHLNSIWKAAGQLPNQNPTQWLRHKKQQEYVSYLENNQSAFPCFAPNQSAFPHSGQNAFPHSAQAIQFPNDVVLVTQNGGTHPGTWACVKLAMTYAAWLDVKYHDEIFQFYLDHQLHQLHQHQQMLNAQLAQLSVVELQRDQAVQQVHTATQKVQDVTREASLEPNVGLETIHEWRCKHGIQHQPWPRGWSIKSVGRQLTKLSKQMNYQIGRRSLAGHNKKVNSYEPILLDMVLNSLIPKKNPFIIF